MPIIQIQAHYEPLNTIPPDSVVDLEECGAPNRRVYFLGLVTLQQPQGDVNVARIQDEDGRYSFVAEFTHARYICSLLDYEALSYA